MRKDCLGEALVGLQGVDQRRHLRKVIYDGLVGLPSRGEQRVEVRLAENWSLGALIEGQRLGLEDVGLHLRQVNVIIELYDVNLLRVLIRRVERDLDEDPGDAV